MPAWLNILIGAGTAALVLWLAVIVPLRAQLREALANAMPPRGRRGRFRPRGASVECVGPETHDHNQGAKP